MTTIGPNWFQLNKIPVLITVKLSCRVLNAWNDHTITIIIETISMLRNNKMHTRPVILILILILHRLAILILCPRLFKALFTTDLNNAQKWLIKSWFIRPTVYIYELTEIRPNKLAQKYYKKRTENGRTKITRKAQAIVTKSFLLILQTISY